MKKIISKITVLSAITFMLSAFLPMPGGEGFEIYLNNKVLVQKFGNFNQVNNIELSKISTSDKLTVKYYHCGKTGKNRIVSVRDNQNRVLKSFRYPDTTPVSAMEVPIGEILRLKGTNAMNLFYSSSELPAGRTLVTMEPALGIANR